MRGLTRGINSGRDRLVGNQRGGLDERGSATTGEAQEWAWDPSRRRDGDRQGDQLGRRDRKGFGRPAGGVNGGKLRKRTLGVVEAEAPVRVAVARLDALNGEGESQQSQQQDDGGAAAQGTQALHMRITFIRDSRCLCKKWSRKGG